jgi:hypothetical protein
VRAITAAPSGDLFVARETTQIDVIAPDRTVTPFLRLEGHAEAELTGLAFSPHGDRLYFSAKRGRVDGHTFEVSGPFRG